MKNRRRTVALPGMHDVDIVPILPILNSERFLTLHEKYQLEMNYLVFPLATHTRFVHSLGTYALTQERVKRWVEDEIIDQNEARNLALFGLLHDIGHGPYSHSTEALSTIRDHKQNGIRVLQEIRAEIEECGGNFDKLIACFTGEEPLACTVSHRPLGTDKLHYLTLDSRQTTESVHFRMGDLINHVSYHNGHLAISRTIMPEVKQLLSDYVDMHDRVYLRRSALITKRAMQKVVAMEMRNQSFTEEQLWDMSDVSLNCAMQNSRDPIVHRLWSDLRCRRLPKMAVCLYPEGTVPSDRLHGKDIAAYEVDDGLLARFDPYRPPSRASEVELALSEITRIPPEDILFIPVITPERMIPEDIPVYDGSRYAGFFHELFPEHFQSLRATARSYAAVRVCVSAQYRKQVASPPVCGQIMAYLQHLATTRS